MAEYFVSICIPTYNQTEFLKKTLDSLCVQTYRNFEVIISDDSTDDRVELFVNAYKDQLNLSYNRNTPSLGSPANWNKALSLSKGDLIKFIHHDDWLACNTALEEFVNVFKKNSNVNFAFCTSEILDVKENKVSYNKPPHSFLEKLKSDPRILFNDNRIGSPTAVMFKKSALRFDERIKYVVDIDFYISLLMKNKNFVFIDRPLIVNTSNHPGQVTTASLNKETQVGEYCYLYNKIYKSKIPDIALSKFFRSLFKKYSVKSLNEVEKIIGEKPKPVWYFKLLVFLSR